MSALSLHRCTVTAADDLFPVTALLAWAFSVATQAQLVRLYDIQALGVHSWEMPLERFLYYSKVNERRSSVTGTAASLAARVPRGSARL